MKNCFLLILFVLSLKPQFSSAQGQEGHGGGLVVRNGETLTFKSANASLFSVHLGEPLTPSEFPDAKEAILALDTVLIDQFIRSEFQEAIRIKSTRNYYRLDEKAVPPAQYAKIVKEYKKVVKLNPTDQLTLGAITVGNDTYLLPAYFKLKSQNSRSAILFHEALWVLNEPWKTYSSIVESEILFEQCLDQPIMEMALQEFGSKRICQKWVKSLIPVLGLNYLDLQSNALVDYAQGNMGTLLDEKGRMKMVDFLGDEIVNPEKSPASAYESVKEQWRRHLEAMSAQFPKSLFFSYLAFHYDDYAVLSWFSNPIFRLDNQDTNLYSFLRSRQDEGFSFWNWGLGSDGQACICSGIRIIQFSKEMRDRISINGVTKDSIDRDFELISNQDYLLYR